MMGSLDQWDDSTLTAAFDRAVQSYRTRADPAAAAPTAKRARAEAERPASVRNEPAREQQGGAATHDDAPEFLTANVVHDEELPLPQALWAHWWAGYWAGRCEEAQRRRGGADP